MSEKHSDLASRVVVAFKESLSEEAQRTISQEEFEKLNLMIAEALTTEKRDTADLFENMARKLKAEAIPLDISM